MNTIIAGSATQFTVTVQRDGLPVVVAGSLSASVYSMDGRQQFIGPLTLSDADIGADWPEGVVSIALEGTDTASLQPGPLLLVLSGDIGIRRFQLNVEALFVTTRTSLFIRDIIVDELRRDRLVSAASGVMQDIVVSDEYLWDKIRAAESEIAHTLRVPLVPTRYFPKQPTQQQIDDLQGMAWEIEIGTDYTPQFFEGDRWGFIVTRQKPIISVDHLQMAYPAQGGAFFVIPNEWLNFDAKYGQIRIVPGTNAVMTMMSGFLMTSMSGGRLIPSMVQLTYTAGLANVETTYPELLDAIKKTAILKVVEDAFLPQSGTISGDGLSQSISVDATLYAAVIDNILNGPKGSNAGLMSKIHGIRTMVM